MMGARGTGHSRQRSEGKKAPVASTEIACVTILWPANVSSFISFDYFVLYGGLVNSVITSQVAD